MGQLSQVTNESIHRNIPAAIELHYKLPIMVRERELKLFGHMSSGLAKTIKMATLKGKKL